MEPGSIFAGRYRVVKRIATGGMGAVYEVSHTATERRFALKVMLPEFAHEVGLRERFQHEARVAARVESEHIVEVMDAGLDDATGTLFLVMELLRGEELGARVKRLGRLTPDEAVTCLRQAASALDKTHAAAIVHRDLKPENLFLTWREDGSARLKLLDFGIAKALAESTTAKRRTESIGTPLYMAPEQFSGLPPSPATDIYALGLIAYTLLVGESYWEEEAASVDNALAFALKASLAPSESAVARACRRGAWLPEEFDSWFAKATHREPSQRFKLASECVSALTAILNNASQPENEERRPTAQSTPASAKARPNLVLTSTAAVPETSAEEEEPPPEVVASHVSLPNAPNTRGAVKESSAHSLSVSSVPGHQREAGPRWRSWAAAGLAVVTVTGILVERALDSAPEAETANPDLGVVTGPLSEGEVIPPNTTVIAGSQTSQAIIEIAGGSVSAATATATSSAPVAPPQAPVTGNSSGTANLSTTSNASTVRHSPAAVSTGVSVPGGGSVIPKQFCYEHPDSGRVVPYKAGASLRGQGTFPCYRTSNGEYRRAK